MEKLKVSIVIPARNEADRIEKALRALKKQSYSNIEIIVVDNGSTDATRAIAAAFADKIVDAPIPGISRAKNAGVKAASGDIIAFTDADCIASEEWVRELVSSYQSHAGVVSVGGPAVQPYGAPEFESCVDDVVGFLSLLGARYGREIKEDCEIEHNPGCNTSYHRSVFDEHGLFDEKLLTCEDAEFDSRIIAGGDKILFNPRAFVEHHKRDSYKGVLIQAVRYAAGRAQAIKKNFAMASWFHFAPTVYIVLIGLLLLFSRRLALVACGAGFFCWVTFALYLAFRSGRPVRFPRYFAIIFLWGIGWAYGFARGLILSSYIKHVR